MTPLYSQQKELEDGSMLLTQWGYCRSQNAVRLGYAVNIVAVLMGLFLTPKEAGLLICVLTGASFGATYFAEQLPSPWQLRLAWAGIVFTVCAYAVALKVALVP
jgi:hypothetical protein